MLSGFQKHGIKGNGSATMKKTIAIVIISIVCGVVARGDVQPISLADARGQIDKAIESKDVLVSIMERLSAEDQKAFLGEMNKAIGDMPASIEEKTATYLNVNHYALKAAKKGNLTTLTAEVFATVPPESLTVINERFAVDLFNRASNPGVTYLDEQYVSICTNLMDAVNKRVEETDNGSPRSAFAILMLIRASNGTPENLADILIDTMKHDDAKELARTEWIPSALGKDGRGLGYEPILASADAGRRPDFAFVLVIAGPQYLDSILADIVGKNTDQRSFIRTRSPVLDAVENPLIHQIPTLDGDVFGAGINPVEPKPKPPEPSPYQWQQTGGLRLK